MRRQWTLASFDPFDVALVGCGGCDVVADECARRGCCDVVAVTLWVVCSVSGTQTVDREFLSVKRHEEVYLMYRRLLVPVVDRPVIDRPIVDDITPVEDHTVSNDIECDDPQPDLGQDSAGDGSAPDVGVSNPAVGGVSQQRIIGAAGGIEQVHGGVGIASHGCPDPGTEVGAAPVSTPLPVVPAPDAADVDEDPTPGSEPASPTPWSLSTPRAGSLGMDAGRSHADRFSDGHGRGGAAAAGDGGGIGTAVGTDAGAGVAGGGGGGGDGGDDDMGVRTERTREESKMGESREEAKMGDDGAGHSSGGSGDGDGDVDMRAVP